MAKKKITDTHAGLTCRQHSKQR